MCLIKTFCIAAVIICFAADVDGQETHAGILESRIYSTSVEDQNFKRMYIYLPAEYYSTEKSYPVVYFLHGANGNERSWIEKGHILEYIDSLTSRKEIMESIYIFPNMNRYYREYDYLFSRPNKSIEAYFGLDGSAEYSFINDIVEYVDDNFRTIPSMKYRGIAGLSLGGLNALYISANKEGYFGYIGLFSPMIYPPTSFGSHSYIYKNIEEKLDEQFAASPPLYVIMIGKSDLCYNSAYMYSEYLERQNYPHVFISTAGGHTWKNWRNYSISFLKALYVLASEDICPTSP